MAAMSNNPQELYKQQRILTASPVELIVLLYEGLKKNIVLASRAVEKNDAAKAHESFIKAQNIVSELMNSLDMSVPISEELLRLYEFILHELIEANVKKDVSVIPGIIEIVDELCSAWQEIAYSDAGSMAASNE
ncbi:MAG: flagellar export chaperone FliS [Oscillospiraceae bacterium]|jgi:flagellar protein FliS|nr:flagellar export chaperone FliS [Oscillospiraceae bacterium]